VLAVSNEQEVTSLISTGGKEGDRGAGFEMDSTSALEKYLKTDSPYGVMELNGEVWEWTRSIWKDYPYQSSDGREDFKRGENRILLGGALYDENGEYQDCMYREEGPPDYWYLYVGFRVVLFPVS
jgi:formylglycine-generating enzyme required for sulfatase activity